MRCIDQIAPAFLRRAFFVFALAASASAQTGTPTAADAGRMIEQVRQADLPGDYYFEFELIALPKRGEERSFRGRMWASRNADGPIKRIEIADAAGKPQRFLLQGGARSAVWRAEGGKVVTVAGADLFMPLLTGVELTAFDLQMPFLYWTNVTLKGVAPVRGRDAHVFVFAAPANFDAQKSQVASARVFLDAQINAIVQTELLDREGLVLKRFSPLSLKTVGRQVVPKAVDYRNDRSGDKARLQFTAVALDLELGPALFQPAALTDDVAAPAPGKLVRLE